MSLEGQLLDGRYLIVRPVAEGGMSTIFLGRSQRIGKDVAVKVLHSNVARDPDIRARFEREAQIASRIRSIHVADVFDLGELPSGEPFIVMEYLEGESLATILERDGTVPVAVLASIAAQILEGLAAGHAAGVIHRDLKPENVIVTRRGKNLLVKLVDFGIAKLLEPTQDCVRVTAAGSVLGTPLYMSPEQARGLTIAIDHRTDLYSLGVMLYEATAGEPPLMGENVNDLLFRVALDEPEPLAAKASWVDPGFAAIVHKAMAKEPGDRYQSADEMLDAIEAWARAGSSAGPAVDTHASDAERRALPSAEALAAPDEPSRVERRPTRSVRLRSLRLAIAAPLLALLFFFGGPIAWRWMTALVAPRIPPTVEPMPDPSAPETGAPAPLPPTRLPPPMPIPRTTPHAARLDAPAPARPLTASDVA